MKNIFLFLFVSISAVINAQPFAVFLNPGNSQYWLVSYDPITGARTDIAYLSGMTGYLSGDYTSFNAPKNEYNFVGYNGALYRFYSVNVLTGTVTSDPILGGNIIGLEYNCNDSLFYGLYEDAGNYFIATLNEITGQVTSLGSVATMDGAVSGSFFLNTFDNTYGFITVSGSNYELRTYQLPSGTLVNSFNFPDNVVGLEYNSFHNSVYGLWNDNGDYKLEEINLTNGQHTTVNTIPGVNPGFIAEAQCSDINGNYTFRGFNVNNQLTIFTIDLSDASIVDSFPNAENSSGLEVGNCLGVTLNTQEEKIESLEIFPNPSKENFTLNSEKPVESYAIYSTTGSLIYRENTNNKTSIQVQTVNLNPGIYFISLTFSNGTFISKRLILLPN